LYKLPPGKLFRRGFANSFRGAARLYPPAPGPVAHYFNCAIASRQTSGLPNRTTAFAQTFSLFHSTSACETPLLCRTQWLHPSFLSQSRTTNGVTTLLHLHPPHSIPRLSRPHGPLVKRPRYPSLHHATRAQTLLA